MAFSDRLQRFVIRTSPYPPFRWIYALAYAAILGWLVIQIRLISQIKRLELRAPSPGHRFGISDLDVRAETEHLTTEQYFRLSERLSHFLRPSRQWRKILDFYLFEPQEWELQRRLGPISFGSAQVTRLLGSKRGAAESIIYPQAPNASLCRSMYEYGSLLQQLLEEDLTLPAAWAALRRFKRIDNTFAAKRLELSSEDLELREDFIERTDHLLAGGPLREMQDADIERLFCVVLAEADALSKDVIPCALASRDSPFELIATSISPDNISDAIDSCASGVAGLCSRVASYVDSAMLGCVPASTFEYRFYLILRPELSISERAEVFRAIRAEYRSKGSHRRISSEFLRLRYPMVLTPAMWCASNRWYHALRPVEEFHFLSRHGALLWGRDLREDLIEPAAIDLIRSAGIAIADLRNLIWEAMHDRRPRRVVDILTGRIPGLWLLLARSIIATSSAEALAGCIASGFPKVEIIQELRAQTMGKRPKSLPPAADSIWKPALEASSKWIDEVARLALSRLDSDTQAN